MKYQVFLDDLRMPTDIYPRTQDSDWIIIRNLTDFYQLIATKGIPEFISFDNDLGASLEEGKDAVKWIVFEKELDISNMDFKVHSANSGGARDYIAGTLNNWKKALQQEKEENGKQ
jgi:hypothetical protein